jgi:hypothetical protein
MFSPSKHSQIIALQHPEPLVTPLESSDRLLQKILEPDSS